MGAQSPKRRTAPGGRACGDCGATLAWDNTGNLCSSCLREQRDQLRTPPAHLPDEFWETDDFRAAFKAQDIGKVLKVYRNHPRHRQIYGRAISQSTLGRWLNLEQSKISRLEGGGPEPNTHLVREYARRLHIPQRLLWILPEGESYFTVQNRVQAEYGPGIAPSGLSALLGWDMRDEAKRRTFLTQAAGMVGTVLTLTDDSLGISGQRQDSSKSPSFDLETLEGLEQTTLGLRRAYRSAGALSLLGASHGTLNLLTEMMPYAGRHQSRLVTAVGQTAGLIGVMLSLDLNDFDAGGHYLSIATRAAKQANNDELLAFILGARAFHAAYNPTDSSGGRDYADAALTIANRGISPITHGWLSAVASEMYATERDELGCRKLLDSAAAHLEAADPNEPWTGIGVFNADKLSAYVGGDLMRLGRYSEAQQHLHDALDRLDGSLLKHRCTAYVDLAEAYAANSQVDEAAEYAKNALAIVSGTRHAMSLKRIEKLYRSVRETNQGAGEQIGEMLIELRATW